MFDSMIKFTAVIGGLLILLWLFELIKISALASVFTCRHVRKIPRPPGEWQTAAAMGISAPCCGEWMTFTPYELYQLDEHLSREGRSELCCGYCGTPLEFRTRRIPEPPGVAIVGVCVKTPANGSAVRP